MLLSKSIKMEQALSKAYLHSSVAKKEKIINPKDPILGANPVEKPATEANKKKVGTFLGKAEPVKGLKGQRWSHDDTPHKEYHVDKLMAHAQSKHPPQKLNLEHLKHAFTGSAHGPSDEAVGSKAFNIRAKDASIGNHPILVGKDKSGKHHIIDGNHRVHHAMANGATHINAHIIPMDKLPDSALVKPKK
jgi:hypothetical protein